MISALSLSGNEILPLVEDLSFDPNSQVLAKVGVKRDHGWWKDTVCRDMGGGDPRIVCMLACTSHTSLFASAFLMLYKGRGY